MASDLPADMQQVKHFRKTLNKKSKESKFMNLLDMTQGFIHKGLPMDTSAENSVANQQAQCHVVLIQHITLETCLSLAPHIRILN